MIAVKRPEHVLSLAKVTITVLPCGISLAGEKLVLHTSDTELCWLTFRQLDVEPTGRSKYSTVDSPVQSTVW